MLKSCGKCGRIHDSSFMCNANRNERTKEQAFRSTNPWRRKSIEVRKAAQYLCEVCRDNGLYNCYNLSVHHITPLTEDESQALDDDNLVCLCGEHHEQAEAGKIDRNYLRSLAKKRRDRLE